MKREKYIEVWIAPVWSETFGPWPEVHGSPERFYAPSFEYAMRDARRTWPTAAGWECIGVADPKNPEYCKPDKKYTGVVYGLRVGKREKRGGKVSFTIPKK